MPSPSASRYKSYIGRSALSSGKSFDSPNLSHLYPTRDTQLSAQPMIMIGNLASLTVSRLPNINQPGVVRRIPSDYADMINVVVVGA